MKILDYQIDIEWPHLTRTQEDFLTWGIVIGGLVWSAGMLLGFGFIRLLGL